MIDGFTPGERYLRDIASKIGGSEMLSKMEKLNLKNYLQYAHPEEMSENSLFNLFHKLRFYLTTREQGRPTESSFPKTWDYTQEQIDKLGGFVFYYTSGSNFRSLENRIGRFLREIGGKDAQSVLTREYENNRRQAPGKHYLQNVVVFNREKGLFGVMEGELVWRWIDLLNFEVKKRETYVDFEAFRDVWTRILSREIDHFVKSLEISPLVRSFFNKSP